MTAPGIVRHHIVGEVRQRAFEFKYQPEIAQQGDSLASVPSLLYTGPDTALVLGSVAVVGTQAVFSVSGGTAGSKYHLRCQGQFASSGGKRTLGGDLYCVNAWTVQTLDAVQQDDDRYLTFDFGNQSEIVGGDALTGTPTVSVIAVPPNGSSSTLPTLGTPFISGTKVLFERTGGSVGQKYRFTCFCPTLAGWTLGMVGDLYLRE